jgi:hypothetical protein
MGHCIKHDKFIRGDECNQCAAEHFVAEHCQAKPETSTKHCQAKQYSDQMQCACGLAWDMNDPEPPECPGATSRTTCIDCESTLEPGERVFLGGTCNDCEGGVIDMDEDPVTNAARSAGMRPELGMGYGPESGSWDTADLIRVTELAKINEALSDPEDKHPSRTLQVRYDDLLAENAKLQRITESARQILARATGGQYGGTNTQKINEAATVLSEVTHV